MIYWFAFIPPQIGMMSHLLYSLLTVLLTIFSMAITQNLPERDQHLNISPGSLKSNNHKSQLDSNKLEIIEATFLRLAGFKKKPKMRSKRTKIPEYIMNLYANQQKNGLTSTNFQLSNKFTTSANIIRHHYHQGIFF